MAKLHFLKDGEVSRKKDYIPASTQYKEIIEELLDDGLAQKELIDQHQKNPITKIAESVKTFFEKPESPIEPPVISPILLNEEKSKELMAANDRIKEMYKIHEDRLAKAQREYQMKSFEFQKYQEKLIYQMFFWKMLALVQCAGIFAAVIWTIK